MENVDMENVVIAGSGPAGLTAAIYTARSGLNPLVLGGLVSGGQLIVSPEVEHYPGFPEPVSDMELMDRFRKQTEQFGARFKTEAFKELVETDKNGLVQVEAGFLPEPRHRMFVIRFTNKRLWLQDRDAWPLWMLNNIYYSKEEVRC
nr:thioredoxin reductase [uncultured archaeon GZfos27E7]